jgi:hypothetical protein
MSTDTTTKKLELKPLEVGVGAGAAVVTAFASSYLGTAGTLTGAALASVIGTVSTSVLRTSAATGAESLRRTTERLRTTRTGPEMDAGAIEAEQADAVEETAAAIGTPGPPATRRTPVRPRWVALGAGAVAAFALALGAITGIESAAGKPLAGITGSDSGGGTTLGRATGSDSGGGAGGDEVDRGTTPTPTPTAEPSGEPTATPTGSAGPTVEGSPSGEPSATTGPGTTSSPEPAPPATEPAPTATGSPAPLTSPSP